MRREVGFDSPDLRLFDSIGRLKGDPTRASEYSLSHELIPVSYPLLQNVEIRALRGILHDVLLRLA